MVIKPSSLAVIVAAFLVAGTLMWIGVIEEGTKKETSHTSDDINTKVASTKPTTTKVGWIGPLSGHNAEIGKSNKQGVQLAEKDLNTSHIETIFKDVKCNIEDAIKAIDKLIVENQVQIIINSVCSTAGLAINPVAQQSHVVVVSPNNTATQFTDSGDYIFRTIPGNRSFGEFTAQSILDENINKITVLYSDDEISQDSRKAFLQHFRRPATNTSSYIFSSNSTNFTSQIAGIKKTNPDAILIITNSKTSARAVVEQITQAKINAKVFGSSIYSNQALLSEISHLPVKFFVITPSRGSDEFIARFKEDYHDSPKPLTAQSYDALVAIARSVEAGADNGPLIRDYLKTIQFEGASGYIQFDDNGNVHNNFQVFTVENGRLAIKRKPSAYDLLPSTSSAQNSLQTTP